MVAGVVQCGFSLVSRVHVRRVTLTSGNACVTLSQIPQIRYYVAADGRQPFAEWFAELESVARAKVTRGIVRLEQGNFSSVKSVGAGVFEYRIDFGPGYRVYFGQDDPALVILLTGGTKKRQQRDIDAAHGYWQDYKQAKRGQH
jgi:putative addiction module killer protein